MISFFNYYSLSLFAGGIVALLSGAAVYFSKEKRSEAFPWMVLNLSTAIWSFGYFSMITLSDKNVATVSNWLLHYGAILIPIFYFYFIISLTKTIKKYNKIFYLIIPVAAFFFFINTSELFLKEVIPKGPFSFAPDAGPFYIYFAIYFFAITIFSQVILYLFIHTLVKKERMRFWFVFYSALFGFLGGGSVFFLTFNILIPPYLLPLFAFYPVIITFAILRYGLFDVRIIAAELLTGILWIILLFRTVIAENLTDQIISGVILLFTTFFGILLIKSVYREVEQREKIEKLAGQLENFIHFLSHEVKGILGKNRMMFGAMMDGDYGEIAPKLQPMIKDSLRDTTNSVNMVMNILQSSDIKNGKIVMNKQPFDFRQAVVEVVDEFRPDVEKKGLQLEMDLDGITKCTVNGDKENIVKHVIKNLLSNSLTYTLSGKIIVGLKSGKEGSVRFFVKDTGLGLSEHTKAKLFTEGGKGEDSSKVNVHSTGYGLYFAKGIIEAHNGKIWAESEGEDKGSTFYVELKCV